MIINQGTEYNDLIARCVAALDRLAADDDDPRVGEIMEGDIGEVADEVARWNLTGVAIARLFLVPMQEALAMRFAIDDACPLYWQFYEAFWFRSQRIAGLSHGLALES